MTLRSVIIVAPSPSSSDRRRRRLLLERRLLSIVFAIRTLFVRNPSSLPRDFWGSRKVAYPATGGVRRRARTPVHRSKSLCNASCLCNVRIEQLEPNSSTPTEESSFGMSGKEVSTSTFCLSWRTSFPWEAPKEVPDVEAEVGLSLTALESSCFKWTVHHGDRLLPQGGPQGYPQGDPGVWRLTRGPHWLRANDRHLILGNVSIFIPFRKNLE